VWCCQEATNTDAQAVEYRVRSQWSEIRNSLAQPASIAEASETCVTAGNLPKAIEIDFDIDQLLCETNTLLNAAALRARLGDG
jgi:hypothetical protein